MRAAFGVLTAAVLATGPVATTPSSTPDAAPFDQSARTVDELLALGRPIVLAHTGGEDEFPASTMFAFRRSMEARVDMLDLNVQITSDGVLVVHHDNDVDRSTNGSGTVASKTAEEMFLLDDAYWFTENCVCRDQPEADYLYRGVRTGERPPPDGFTADDFAVPRLTDVFTAFPDIPINIEIKGSGDTALAAVDELARVIEATDRTDSVVVSSFDDPALQRFVQIAPGVEVTPGLGATAAWVLDATPLPDGQRILQLPPEYAGLEVLTPDVIERSHVAGYVIWVWPNNRDLENPAAYDQFLADGVDGLNVNFPAAGVAAVERFVAAA